MTAFLFLGPSQRDSNPTGCGAEETRSVFQRSTRGAERRSGARAAPAARGHPSSPTTELETVLARGPFCLRPFHGIRTRQGAELRKREAFSSAAREERSDEADAGGASRTRHPSSPTIELLGPQRWRPFFFSGPSQRDSNPPARLSQRPWSKNGKNEYCYFVCII